MIELIAVHEPTEIRANHGQLPPSSFTKNGIYYRLIGYVESKHGTLLGKYEPVIEQERKLPLLERIAIWLEEHI